MWRKLYHLAMLESDRTRLAPLLDDAINTVLDRIEVINTHDELEELNKALNDLRLRRKPVTCGKRGQAGNSDESKAA
jgi:hypothetical protein